MIFRFLPFLLLLVAQASFAARYVPRLMNSSERKLALEILGFGSGSKILGNPYSLGGYSGVELGLSTEYLPIQDLASLGDKTSRRTEINYYDLSIGKGIFHNVDTFIYFTPGFQNEDISGYGGQVRWGFYEFPFLPGGLTLVVHGRASNFASLIDTRTSGYDVVASVVIEDVTLYFGLGEARTLGTFSGGTVSGGKTESTTNSCVASYCEDAYEDLRENHTLFGINLNFADYFASFEISRFYISTYSAKLGFRF